MNSISNAGTIERVIRKLFAEYKFVILFAWREHGEIRLQAMWQDEKSLAEFACLECGLDLNQAPKITGEEAYKMIFERRKPLFACPLHSADEAIRYFCAPEADQVLSPLKQELLAAI